MLALHKDATTDQKSIPEQIAPKPENEFLNKKTEIIPSQLAVCSKPGRKHTYKGGKVLVNEDSWGYFTIQVPISKTGRAFPVDETKNNEQFESFFSFYIADGHGQAIKLAKDLDANLNWNGSQAEQFCKLLQKELPTIIKNTLETALLKYSEMSEKTPNVLDVLDKLKDELSRLHQRINTHLEKLNRELLAENGSTFCLAVVWRTFLLAVNIGDSSMIFFDRSTGEPLQVWKRENNHHKEADPHCEICSYEDTLAHYPMQIREGQYLKVVKKDFDLIINNCRIVTNVYGQRHYPVYSFQSPYGLAMTNTLGNLNHKGRTFSRASVYHFDLSELSALSRSGDLTLCFVTDGIKDVLSCKLIGNFFQGLQVGLLKLLEEDTDRAPIDNSTLQHLSLDDLLYLVAGGQVTKSQRAKQIISTEPISLEQLGYEKSSRFDGASVLAQAEIKTALISDLNQRASFPKKRATQPISYPSLVSCAKAIVNTAILKQTCDDVTCLLVEFQPREKKPPAVASASYTEPVPVDQIAPIA